MGCGCKKKKTATQTEQTSNTQVAESSPAVAKVEVTKES
jgi:hypothetical protein